MPELNNSGETLDVISIDKDTTNSPSTSSNDGGSVIPAVLGIGVAGAAVAGGAKIIHDKKNKDEMYSYDDEESEEDLEEVPAEGEEIVSDEEIDTEVKPEGEEKQTKLDIEKFIK